MASSFYLEPPSAWIQFQRVTTKATLKYLTMKEIIKIYPVTRNWFSLWIKQQQYKVQPALPWIKTNHPPQNRAKEQQLLGHYQTWFLKMQSQVFTLPGKVPSRLLNTELFEISSCEPRSRNLSFTCILHPLLPSGLKLENSSQRHWHLHISQPTSLSFKASLFLPSFISSV